MTFTATLHAFTSEYFVASHLFAESVTVTRHAGEMVIGPGYHAVWFVFNGRPYDVARVYRPDGSFTGYYVDILEPVHWRGTAVESVEPLVDLFLDVWITPSGRYEVLDEDEFEDALKRGLIDHTQAAHARSALRDVLAGIEAKRFPPPVVREFAM